MQAAPEPQRRQYSPLGVIFIRNRSPKEDQEALRHDGLECTPVAAHFWDSQIEKCMQEVVLTCGSVPFMHRYTDESATQHGTHLRSTVCMLEARRHASGAGSVAGLGLTRNQS